MLKEGNVKRTAARESNKPEGRSRLAAWWMICRSGEGHVEAMTLPCCDGEALALFGHEEEAALFLWSLGAEGSEGGWRVRESRCGEVVSVLCGPCARAGRVVLDSPPAMAALWIVELASVDRGSFMGRLLAQG